MRLVLAFVLAACAARAPDPERRDQPVDSTDLRILEHADAILASEAVWNRADNRECLPDARTFSLYCALWKGSIEVTGEYQHRRAALQEVRFVVEEETRGRKLQHRLMDFNNLPETTFSDVKRVLATATARIRARLPSH